MNPPHALNLKNSKDAAKSWKDFKQAWEVYEIASGTVERQPLVRLATFLHVAGPDALEKYNGFMFRSEEEKRDIDVVIAKFDADCKSSVNILAERQRFFKRTQGPDETYDQFVTDLRSLCASCEFSNPDEALRDQFSLNLANKRAKERILNEAHGNYTGLSFEKTIAIAKSHDVCYGPNSEKETFHEPMEVNKTKTETSKPLIQCKFCGRKHAVRNCPAYGKTCIKCSRMNHFAAVCRAGRNKVHQVNDQCDEEEVTENKEFIDNNII